MPVAYDSASNTVLRFSVAPTVNADVGFIALTWPATLPNPSGLLQSDGNGNMRWASAAGLPPGAVRSYTAAFIGTSTDGSTPTVMQRATGSGSGIVLPKPVKDPSGYYIEAVVRTLDGNGANPSFGRVFTGMQYTGGVYTPSGNVSFQADLEPYVTAITFPVTKLQDGTGGALLGMSVTAAAGATFSADVIAFAEPEAST